MAFLDVGDQCRLVLWAQQGSQAGLMVHHYECNATGGGSATDQDAVTALSTIFGPLIKPLMATTASYLGALFQILRPTLRPTVYSTAGNGAGTALNDPLPSQTTGIITLRSNVAGRGGRGRKYIPFPAEGDNLTGQTPTAGYLTAAGSLGTALVAQRVITGMVGNTATLVPIIFRRANPVGSPLVESFTVRSKWATQRRRGSYGRPNASPF